MTKAKSISDGKKSLIRTSLLFIALVGVFNLIIYILSNMGYLNPFIAFTTNTASYLMQLSGLNAEVSAATISLHSRILDVTLECTAIFIMAIYAALVIAYPTSKDRKIKGLLFGIPLIVAINLVRLLFAAVVAEKFPGYFDYIHDYLWRIAFIMLTAALWLFWAEKGERDETKTLIHS